MTLSVYPDPLGTPGLISVRRIRERDSTIFILRSHARDSDPIEDVEDIAHEIAFFMRTGLTIEDFE